MSIPREELYTYRVEWSEEDQEFVGTVAEFPSLSCLADSSLEALSGIQQVVLQAIDILEEEGKPVPEPYRLRQEPPMHTRGRPWSWPCFLSVPGTTHAHAGQTVSNPRTHNCVRNHPCTRGADLRFRPLSTWNMEPPMHTRGRHLLTRYNARMSAKLYSVACIMQ